MTCEFDDIETPSVPRSHSDTGELLLVAAKMFGGALVVLAVAAAIEVADLLAVVREYREGRA